MAGYDRITRPDATATYSDIIGRLDWMPARSDQCIGLVVCSASGRHSTIASLMTHPLVLGRPLRSAHIFITNRWLMMIT